MVLRGSSCQLAGMSVGGVVLPPGGECSTADSPQNPDAVAVVELVLVSQGGRDGAQQTAATSQRTVLIACRDSGSGTYWELMLQRQGSLLRY